MSGEPPSPKRLKVDDHQEGIIPSRMIILVGLPGSGKSTFASTLIRQSPLRWARINQDSIKKGKRGTRDMCLDAATLALNQGINVIIDRTNISPEQRKYFIDMATEAGVDPANVHCVFLNLPVKECGARAAGRAAHEGGVMGKLAYATVGRMQKELAAGGKPSLTEGFASIFECQNDAELDLALKVWVRYTTQIHNEETDLLDLNAEWEKVRPKRKKVSSTAGALGSGLQPIDKFFIKKTAATIGREGASTSTDAAKSITRSTLKVAEPSPLPPSQAQVQNLESTNAKTNTAAVGAGDAFSLMMSASKQQQHQTPSSPPKKQTGGKLATRHHFHSAPALYALQHYLRNPEQQVLRQRAGNGGSGDANEVLYCDSQCVIISDKYPKSRYHILVLSRDQRLQGPLDLTGADSALVQHMKTVGLQWAADHAPESTSEHGFAAGFHSVPSMRQLHLHIISKDYDSASLKNKKHWNSFTTSFFLDVDWVLRQLENMKNSGQQYLEYDVEEKELLLKGSMTCPKCRAVLSRMPDVKAHVAMCTSSAKGEK